MFTNTYNIVKLPAHHFSFERWRAGSLIEFGIKTRTWSISLNRQIIRKYTVGYIKGEKLWVRAKPDTVAVMFHFRNNHFWTHLTVEEFKICFTELK